MQRNIGRGGFILLGFSLLIAACGGDGVLGTGDTGTTVPVATEIIEPPVTSEAPPETTEVPPETTAATAPTTTTFSPGARCQSEGGVFAAAEGPDGVCFPADAITAEEYVIRSVDLDDVDGGLRVWSGPGAPDSKVPQEDKYDETGVIPPYGDGVTATGHATPDGLWFHIQYAGFEGWARSSFMVPSGGAPPLPVCMTGSIGPIPASAQAITSMQANFDGKADQDTFSIYWNGSDWIAHMRTAYGFHSEMSSGHTGQAPGSGGEVFAGFPYDFEADGQFEAWIYDTAIMSGETWSTFAWFNQGCTLYHVTHHDGGLAEYWTVDATVTHVNSMSCYVNGVAQYTGTSNGPSTYQGQAWEHWYSYEDGLAAEWYMIDGMEWNEADGDTIPSGFECP